MKKIILTLFIISSLQPVAFAGKEKGTGKTTKTENPVNHNKETDPPLTEETHLIYSEEQNALVLSNQGPGHSTNIVIKSLPPLSNRSTPINIVLPKGKYTLSKSNELVIPGDYHIYIEDVDEEKHYNLNLSGGHPIKSYEEEVPGRFILHIERPGIKQGSN